MTVIAYRDGVMAADSAIHDNGTLAGFVRKIARAPNGALAGAAGSCGVTYRFTEWFADGAPGDFEPDCEAGDFSAIIVQPDASTWRMDHRGHIFPTRGIPFMAEGCGRLVALGALAAGATAERAVAIAVTFETYCGGAIQVELLGDA